MQISLIIISEGLKICFIVVKTCYISTSVFLRIGVKNKISVSVNLQNIVI